MADSTPKRDALPVGESYRKDLTFELEITRKSPAVWEVTSHAEAISVVGVTEDLAVALFFANVAEEKAKAAMTEIQESEEKKQAEKESTRRIVGNDVSSEQLRDTYLGGRQDG